MATKFGNINGSSLKNTRGPIYDKLLEEAIKGLTDLKAGKTLSLAQIESRHRNNRLSSEQRLIRKVLGKDIAG